jgi:repressor LexA
MLYREIQTGLNDDLKAPTIKELTQKLELSTRKVLEALRELEDSLIIKRSPYKSRSIELIALLDEITGKACDTDITLPILGTAPGGPWLFAQENIEDTIRIPSRLIRGQKDVYLLRVVGNSMSPYLDDGDLALVKRQEQPNESDIVVALRESTSEGYEATIKEYHTSNNQIILNPLNRKEVKPIVGTRNEIRVQGVVIGAIKMFNDKHEDEYQQS